MNIWVTKGLRFGYRYTTDRQMRKHIIESVEWLINVVKKRNKGNDILIISGGIFNNTNPSIIAINDAVRNISELSKYIKVILVNSSKDTKSFDKTDYTTLDLFSSLDNVSIVKDITTVSNITIIPYMKMFTDDVITLDTESNLFNGKDIPNLMQVSEDDGKPGLIVYNTSHNKQMVMPNTHSPIHKTFIISNYDELKDFDGEKYEKDFIHLVLNEKLTEKKLEVDIILHKIKPTSVKYVEQYNEEQNIDVTVKGTSISLDIIKTIRNHIKDDSELTTQFERVLSITKNKKD